MRDSLLYLREFAGFEGYIGNETRFDNLTKAADELESLRKLCLSQQYSHEAYVKQRNLVGTLREDNKALRSRHRQR